MRYFLVSDIHGRYDKLIKALTDANFDKEKDCIVSLGDVIDRGNQVMEVIDFLLSCPNRILMWGNHEDAFWNLLKGNRFAVPADVDNGVCNTITSVCRNIKHYKCKDITVGLCTLLTDNRVMLDRKKLYKYFDELVYAAEWTDLVATHAFLPVWLHFGGYYADYREDWKDATKREWQDALWTDTADILYRPANVTNTWCGKKTVLGHFWAWKMAEEVFIEQSRTAGNWYKEWCAVDCSTFETADHHFVFIDGCVQDEKYGLVNVYIHDAVKPPIIIR